MPISLTFAHFACYGEIAFLWLSLREKIRLQADKYDYLILLLDMPITDISNRISSIFPHGLQRC